MPRLIWTNWRSGGKTNEIKLNSTAKILVAHKAVYLHIKYVCDIDSSHRYGQRNIWAVQLLLWSDGNISGVKQIELSICTTDMTNVEGVQLFHILYKFYL